MGLGWGVVPPIFPTLTKLVLYEALYKKKDIIIFSFLLLIGFILYVFLGNFSSMYNLGVIGLIVLYKQAFERDISVLQLSPIVIWIIISFLLALSTPQIPGEMRYRFYGGEINFTGFHLVILSLIFFHRNAVFAGYISLAMSFILTLSRSAFVSAIFIIMLKLFRNNNRARFYYFIFCISILIYYLYNFTDLISASKGYSMGPSRLLKINDSSLTTRLYMIEVYSDILFSKINYFLFGVPNDVIDSVMLSNELTNVVHNSFIYKLLDVGFFITVLVIISGFKLLPYDVMAVILLYSLSLHALLSPSLFLLLSFFIDKKSSL